MLQGESESGWCAVVEDIHAVLLGWVWDVGEEGIDCAGDIVEGVCVIGGRGGEAETWKVRRDDAVVLGEDGDEVAVLVGRRWEAME